MRKKIKRDAKSILFSNYKYFFVPIILYELLVFFNSSFCELGLDLLCNTQNHIIGFILVVLWLIFQFIILPATIIVFYKMAISLFGNKLSLVSIVQSFLNTSNLFKIMLIYLVPNFLVIINTFIKYFKNDSNNLLLYFFIRFIFLIAIFISEYKFFACKYCFALNQGSVRETLKASFGVMKKRLADYTIYNLSFMLWDFLIIVIEVIAIYFFNILNINSDYLQLLISSGFGIMLFYRPYKFLADFLYIKNSYMKHN